jgi:hypothetical protein
VAGFEGGPNHFADQLRAGGHEQQRFALHGHLRQVVVEQDAADAVADDRAAGVLAEGDGQARLAQRRGCAGLDGSLARAVGPVEHEEPAAKVVEFRISVSHGRCLALALCSRRFSG